MHKSRAIGLAFFIVSFSVRWPADGPDGSVHTLTIALSENHAKQLSPSDIIVYEAYDVWSTGINVGFADGHIEFMKEESDFRKRLPE